MTRPKYLYTFLFPVIVIFSFPYLLILIENRFGFIPDVSNIYFYFAFASVISAFFLGRAKDRKWRSANLATEENHSKHAVLKKIALVVFVILSLPIIWFILLALDILYKQCIC